MYRALIAVILMGLMPGPLAAADDDDAGPLGQLPRSFTGTLPAASRAGVDWQLDLLADGSFQLRRTDPDPASDGAEDAIGRWFVGSDEESLLLAGGAEAIAFAIESPDRLQLLDQAARPIDPAPDEALKSAEVALLEPELELRGRYRYMADAALFEECLTGRRLPVAFTEDNLALERAYLALQETAGQAPGEPALAELIGRIALLPPMEGDGLVPQLEPVRFLSVHADATCPEPFTQATLAGPDWLLLDLGHEPIALAAEQRRPFVTLIEDGRRVAGFAGCNRLSGGVETEDAELRFGPTAVTMMACPVGMDLEAALLGALEATRRYRILGQQLDLFDANGAPLARFEAGVAEMR